MNRKKSIFRRIFQSPFFCAFCICLLSVCFAAFLTSGILPQPNDNAYYASSRAVMVNINEADIADLTLLDGIGYARAEDIIRYRRFTAISVSRKISWTFLESAKASIAESGIKYKYKGEIPQ